MFLPNCFRAVKPICRVLIKTDRLIVRTSRLWYDWDMFRPPSMPASIVRLSIFFAVVVASESSASGDDQWQSLANFVDAHCIDCHSGDSPTADLSLETFRDDYLTDLDARPDKTPDTKPLELILRRVQSRQMPPPDFDGRPSEAAYETATKKLSDYLDSAAERIPRVGRVDAIRRLTRTEYQNAIRDLLGVQIDAAELLPKDESSHGFDNVTVSELSPTLIQRYVSAAQKIAMAATGASSNMSGVTIRVPADRTQERHVAGLPFGTRGGTVFEHQFPQSGDYEIQIKLTRDRDEKVEGLHREHQLDILLDRKRVKRFTITPPSGKNGWENRDFTHVDSHLKARVAVTAGSHNVGVTFPNVGSSLEVSKRQPFDASFNRHRHPRKTPAIFQVTVVGPFSSDGPGDTKSRRLIFGTLTDQQVAQATASQRRNLAKTTLRSLARRAYRREVDSSDIQPLLKFYDQTVPANLTTKDEPNSADLRAQFDAGVQAAVAAVLVNPNFLLKIESQPENVAKNRTFRLSDIELANRLSWFLWSSIPDQQLLDLAHQQRLADPQTLADQVTRMLRDPKADSLVTNFANQWLLLRNLESITPDLRAFPDFDDNLRQAFRQETQSLFADIMRNDRSVLDLIQSDHTFLNERLATHYDIPGVAGSHFRKVILPANSRRGGLLRHGSVLMVTSYATRTSPTIRGNWVLETILGTPAPPPPPNVPNMKENSTLVATSVRERLAQHRRAPACAGCHNLMDPVGFSLENFDVVGRWREYDDEIPVDAVGRLPDGTDVNCLEDLENGILKRPDMFVQAMTEKMMTYALGRGVEHFDGPTVRKIVRDAAESDYRFSALVQGIVNSNAFQMRSAR